MLGVEILSQPFGHCRGSVCVCGSVLRCVCRHTMGTARAGPISPVLSALSCQPGPISPVPAQARLVPVMLQGPGSPCPTRSPEVAAAAQGTPWWHSWWLHSDTPRAAAETCLGPLEPLKCRQK